MFPIKKDYHYWRKKFFEGSLLIPGWNTIKSELVSLAPETDKDAFAQQVDELGDKISQEWAQVGGRITSIHLNTWAQDLKTSKKGGFATVRQVLKKITEQVDDLLV